MNQTAKTVLRPMKQKDVCSDLDISKQSLVTWRDNGKLKEGEHWYNDGRLVFYTSDGIAQIRKLKEKEPSDG